MKIEFYRHSLNDLDKQEVARVLDSIFLSLGERTKVFENKFATYLGRKHVVGVNSCTAALGLALSYFGIKAGDEVITTPMSFIATANAIEACGAKPVFVDVRADTANINADLIDATITENTKAIIPVHLYGHMCNMKKIKAIADKHNLKIIEDCAHCIEGECDGIKPGELADMACFSFYATKNITCGEGGAITCDDEKIYDWMLKARLHGMSKNAADRYSKKYEHYDMEILGFKYNMNDIQAALLIHQIDRIDNLLLKRDEVANKYDAGFGTNSNIKIPAVVKGTKSARHLYTIWVDPNKRDQYLEDFQNVGIGVAINYRAIHLMKYYREKYGYNRGMYPEAEKIGDSTISLPFYPQLTSDDIDYIVEQVNKITQ